MNTVVLRRRLFYICAMVALLVPIYFLGRPSVRNPDGSPKADGGILAKLRTENNLGQGDLGEIDPASESMRLATLGLRGVAATILWQKAEDYKREQSWDRLSATLNQIAVLQPHFIKVWEFQSHNLSYNVSAEFDNYRHRYQWVKRGMEYLVKGGKYNKKRTEIPYELGWFFGNKFGVADEKKQFRELYKMDDIFHDQLLTNTGLDLTQPDGMGPDRRPDNWLSGRLWYERAYSMVDGGSRPARSEMMFYRMGPQWMMKYCEAIQGDGVLDKAARYAWESAGRDWKRFGERQILTSFGDTIYLTEVKTANDEYAEANEQFIEFCDEAYQQALDEKKSKLTPEELAIHEMEYTERDFEQVLIAEDIAARLSIRPMDVAREAGDDIRVQAMQMAKDLEAKQNKITHIEIYRNQINYSYWEQRCIAEQEDAALAARVNMYEADQLLEEGDLDLALEKYEVAWRNWEALFNKHPAMMIDDAADDVLAAIDRYRRLRDLAQLPDDFGLAKFMEFRDAYDDALADPSLMSVIANWRTNYPNRNFLDEMLRKSKDLAAKLEAGEGVEATLSLPGTVPPRGLAEETDSAVAMPPTTESPIDDAGSAAPSTASEPTTEDPPTNPAPAKSDSSPATLPVEQPDPGSAPDPKPPASEQPPTEAPTTDAPQTDPGANGDSPAAAPKPDLSVEKPSSGNAPKPPGSNGGSSE